MSVGHSVDINKLMSDNQRYQRDLSYAHHQQQLLRSQLDKAIASNNHLREDRALIERQKQQELDSFINNHRQIYEAQLKALTQQNQSLKAQLLQYSQEDNHQKCKLELRIAQQEQEAKSDQVNRLRRMKQQNIKLQQELTKQLKNKQSKIVLLEQNNLKQYALLQKSTQQFKQLKNRQKALQQCLSQVREQYQAIKNATPQNIIEDLFRLRKQKISLLQHKQEQQLQMFRSDQYVYNMIQKLHKQLALLRYQLVQAQNIKAQESLFYYQQKEAFQRQKAQLQLHIINLQRQLKLERDELQKSRKTIKQLEGKERKQVFEAEQRAKLEQQLALMQIKIFVLQSLKDIPKGVKRQLRHKYQHLTQIRQQKSNYLSSMELLMSQTTEKLNRQQLMRRQLSKKVKQYKSRCQTHSRTESQLTKMIEQSMHKEQQYRRLIEKIQAELQKSYEANNHILQGRQSQKTSKNQQNLYQQIEMLKKQIQRNYQSLQQEKTSHRQQEERMKKQIKGLQSLVGQLKQKNCKLEAKIFEQTLILPSSKSNRNYQVELADKTAAVILLENELQKLRSEVELGKEISEQRMLKINQLNSKVDTLTWRMAQQAKSRVEEISQLKQKNAYLQGMLGEKRNSEGIRLLNLCEQIVHLKTESNDLRQDTVDRSGAQREVQSYRMRLVELQQALRLINSENEQKSIEIFRLNNQNNTLSKQLDKLEEQLDGLRTKAGSMRQFELMDRNKQLQEGTQTIKKQLNEALEVVHMKQSEFEGMRNQCDQAWKNNLELVLQINQLTSQLKEAKAQSDNNQRQWSIRQKQLQNRVVLLQNQKMALKKEMQEQRQISINKQLSKISQVNRQSLMSIQLQSKQIQHLKQEIDRQTQQRKRQRLMFDEQWRQLSIELNQAKQQLQSYLSNSNHQNSRIQIITSQHISNSQHKDLLSKIDQLQKQLSANNERIMYLELQKRQWQYSIGNKEIYSNQLVEVRQDNQRLLQAKFKLQDRLRVLEQENSLLKIRKITQQEPSNNQIFSQQTFGPSLGSMELIAQLKQADHPNLYVQDGLRQSHQEALCLLVISWAQIQSLRAIIEQIQQKSQQNYEQYIQKLKAIQLNLGQAQRENSSFHDLIKQLECSHRHIVQIAQRRFVQGRQNTLAQMGTLAESITGTIIQQYSIQGEQSQFDQT